VPLLAALASIGITPAAAATHGHTLAANSKPGITIDTWSTEIQLKNQTQFHLRLLDSSKTEMTDWDRKPLDDLASGGEMASSVKNTTVAFGHGVAQIVVYGVYEDNGDYVGMVVLSNGIDCEKSVKVLCLDYHRWQQTWSSPLSGARYDRLKLTLHVFEDQGPPEHYHTVYALQLQPGSPEPTTTTTTTTVPPTSTTSTTSTTAPSAGSSAGATSGATSGTVPNGFPGTGWGWIQQVENHSPFMLTPGYTWNSQYTDFIGSGPPSIPSGIGIQYLYGNSASLHGPQSFSVYNAFMPSTKAYVGSVVVEAQTDCDFGAKVLEIPTTCLVFHSSSFSVAAGIPAVTLSANSETKGLPPLSAIAHTVIFGNEKHPEPPPAS
jgi:hypothetical protein